MTVSMDRSDARDFGPNYWDTDYVNLRGIQRTKKQTLLMVTDGNRLMMVKVLRQPDGVEQETGERQRAAVKAEVMYSPPACMFISWTCFSTTFVRPRLRWCVVSDSGEAMSARRVLVPASTNILYRLTSWRRIASRSASSFHQPCVGTARSNEENADINWDDLGFGHVPTDYMYVMRCSRDDKFSSGVLNRYGNIELSPSAGVLNYGQAMLAYKNLFKHLSANCEIICLVKGLFEGLKAYQKQDGSGFLLFRPEENARRMQRGAERMCMPSLSVVQFIHAVKETVLANKRWVPPQGKGSLYIRPLLIGIGPVLGLAPAPDYMFLIYAAPVGTYFKEGLAPINLVIDDKIHRATPGGTGDVKTISNYAPALKAQTEAKTKGFTDVIYLDSINKKYLEEASSCNLFIVKGDVISTPATMGTILPGVTRKSIIEIAIDYGFRVEERLVSLEDLLDADEVFCTGTAVVVAPVSSITYQDQRYEYKTGTETVTQKLYNILTAIQMGLVEDRKNWTVEIK
nr:PREDICTED: branched-chain-amino-acid aminotransferase 2, chloroplastic isoform X3 [Musa acuminata subsp. malaccensis]